MKILLVEDSSVDRMFVTHALRSVVDFNHELVTCVSLAAAKESMLATNFDVVLLDLCLTDSDGLETCQAVTSTFRGIPVVVMTGTDDRAMAKKAMLGGAQDYLVKGEFPGTAISRVLQYAVDRFQLTRELAQRDFHFQQILSHVPAIIWTTNRELTITSMQGAGLAEIQLVPGQIVGSSVREFMSDGDASEESVMAHEVAVSGNSISLELKHLGRIFEAKIDPLHEPEFGVVGTIGLALDVTERRNLDHEINFARLIQEGLLPAEPPHIEGFDIHGGSFSAKQTCGDWFDFLNLSDSSVALVVGDVSGKGFGPAILSATIAAYLEALAENHSDLQEILTLCNRLICKRGLDGQFAVLSAGRLRAGEMSVTYGGAGEEILIVGQEGQLRHQVPASGLPLGVMEDAVYDPSSVVDLLPGDVLLFLTDGFREAMNEDDNQYGISRIVATVAENQSGSARDIFNMLLRSSRQFSACVNQQDDMTGIVVKVLER